MQPPFDTDKFVHLMERAGVDLLLATSRHNVRYLTGYYLHFKEQVTAEANSQYLPVVGIPRRRLEDGFYVGMDEEELDLIDRPLWIEHLALKSGDAAPDAEVAAELARGLIPDGATIGVE